MKENKEQKTVTALQFLLTETNSPEFTHELDELCENYLCISQIMEQYAQAKVLEALEPQKELIEELLTIFNGNGVPNIRYVTKLINHYYETEVKPKYKKK